MSLAADSNPVKILAPDSKPYGSSYEEHIKNFWKYILSIPEDKNPWSDYAGYNCAIGQVGKNSSVFYLSNNGGDRSDRICNVPAGKGLFIPISPIEASDKEAPGGNLIEIAKHDQDRLTDLRLKIGDKVYSLGDLKAFRIPTGEFNATFASNGLFGIREGGPTRVAADGYYVITEPLAKGNYSIEYGSTLPPTADIPAQFVNTINYKLIVK